MPIVNVGFGFNLQADVVLEDGTKHRVGPFGPSDLIAFERHFKVPSIYLRDMLRTEWVAFLAFNQLAHRKLFSGNFDDFVGRLSDMTAEADVLQPEEEDEEPGPATEPSPSGSP
jgi:hypothetical protein